MLSYTDEETGVLFRFNSKFADDVHVYIGEEQFSVPGQAILRLVFFCYISRELINFLEGDIYSWFKRLMKRL
jgi:hypothetical protein